MVKIRLKRMGKNKSPFYRLVVADARAPRDGRFIAEVGYFNPISKDFKIDKPLIIDWLNKGAQPSDVVRMLLKKEGVIAEFTKAKIAKRVATPKKEVVQKTTSKPKVKKVTVKPKVKKVAPKVNVQAKVE